MSACFAFCNTIQWTYGIFIVLLFHIRYDVKFYNEVNNEVFLTYVPIFLMPEVSNI